MDGIGVVILFSGTICSSTYFTNSVAINLWQFKPVMQSTFGSLNLPADQAHANIWQGHCHMCLFKLFSFQFHH
jgi:hypothetical protein